MYQLLMSLVVGNLGLLVSSSFDKSPKPVQQKGCYRAQTGERVTFSVTCFATAVKKTILFSAGTKYEKNIHIA